MKQKINDYLLKPFYINYPYLLALKASSLTAGAGIIFDSENKDIVKKLNEFWEKEQGQLKLRKMLFSTSLYGRSMLFLQEIFRDNEKALQLKYVQFPLSGRIAKFNEEEQVAEILDKAYSGDYCYTTKIKINSKDIKVEVFSNLEPRAGTTITDKINEPKLISSNKFKNPFSAVPFVEIENYNIPNFYNNNYYGLPDWWLSKDLINHVQETIKIKNVELKSNRTRTRIEATAEQLNKMRAQGLKSLDDIWKDALVVVEFNKDYSKSTANQTMEVYPGDPKLSSYQQELMYLEEQIFNKAGYSPFNSSGSDDNYENKTASLGKDKLDIQTTKLKQSMLIHKLYRLFDMVLSYYDLEPIIEGERQYTINIKSLNMLEIMTKIDDLKKLKELGAISLAEVRAEALGIPLYKAKKDIENLQDEELERMAFENEMLYTDNQNENINKDLKTDYKNNSLKGVKDNE